MPRLRDRYVTPRNEDIVEKLQAFAQARGHTMLELAFSWLASRPQVASVIAGATRVEQVEQNVKAIGWTLSAADGGDRQDHEGLTDDLPRQPAFQSRRPVTGSSHQPLHRLHLGAVGEHGLASTLSLKAEMIAQHALEHGAQIRGRREVAAFVELAGFRPGQSEITLPPFTAPPASSAMVPVP